MINMFKMISMSLVLSVFWTKKTINMINMSSMLSIFSRTRMNMINISLAVNLCQTSVCVQDNAGRMWDAYTHTSTHTHTPARTHTHTQVHTRAHVQMQPHSLSLGPQ